MAEREKTDLPFHFAKSVAISKERRRWRRRRAWRTYGSSRTEQTAEQRKPSSILVSWATVDWSIIAGVSLLFVPSVFSQYSTNRTRVRTSWTRQVQWMFIFRQVPLDITSILIDVSSSQFITKPASSRVTYLSSRILNILRGVDGTWLLAKAHHHDYSPSCDPIGTLLSGIYHRYSILSFFIKKKKQINQATPKMMGLDEGRECGDSIDADSISVIW